MARYFRRRKFCKFTAEGTKQIDYKDLETLRPIYPRLGKLSRVELQVPKHGTNANWRQQLKEQGTWH